MRGLNKEELGFVCGAGGSGRRGNSCRPCGGKSRKSNSRKSKSKKSKSKKHSRSRRYC